MADIQFKPSFEQRVGIIDPLRADRAHNNWHKVNFDPPFSSDKAKSVLVIPMTQTYNGGETPGLRIKGVTHEKFYIRFDEAVIITGGGDGADYSANGSHVDETVGWVAYALKP